MQLACQHSRSRPHSYRVTAGVDCKSIRLTPKLRAADKLESRSALLPDFRKLDDIADQLRRILPDSVQQMGEDVRANVHTLLEAALRRMDLVSREEFEQQAELLARTRAKLAELEAILATLEESD